PRTPLHALARAASTARSARVAHSLRSFASVSTYIGRVDFDTDGLSDQIHREHEPRVRTLPRQAADDPLQGTVRHFHHHPLTNERARIELQIALHQPPDGLDLVLGNRDDLAVERNDADYAGTGQNGQALAALEPGEAVARKQRPLDLLLAIL